MPVISSELKTVQSHAQSWLFDTAAPLWSSKGVLADGMFAERLSLTGEPVVMSRRIRVQARQIYSFCAIGKMGWAGDWQAVVEGALNKILTDGRRSDGLFIHSFDTHGKPDSHALDLYDHAFILFALAHASSALGRPQILDTARDVRDLLLKTWLRPAGGFWEGDIVACPPHRQNPHMHMLEAALANHEAGGGDEWRHLADQINDLFVSKFWDPVSGAVTEYFEPDWSRLHGAEGSIAEPGHCFEWAWLFEVGFGQSNGPAISDRLTAFARQYGLSEPNGVAINEITLSGAVRDGGARLWPQTERLKAAVARFKRLGTDEEAAEIVDAYRGLQKYLQLPTRGVWRDRLNADGSWVVEASPASSFYHIVCALSELKSLE